MYIDVCMTLFYFIFVDFCRFITEILEKITNFRIFFLIRFDRWSAFSDDPRKRELFNLVIHKSQRSIMIRKCHTEQGYRTRKDTRIIDTRNYLWTPELLELTTKTPPTVLRSFKRITNCIFKISVLIFAY